MPTAMTPEDILNLQGPHSLDEFLGQAGLRDDYDTAIFLAQLQSLGQDPAYRPSIASWQKKLADEKSLHYFPGVVRNLYAAQKGNTNPPPMSQMLDEMNNLF